MKIRVSCKMTKHMFLWSFLLLAVIGVSFTHSERAHAGGTAAAICVGYYVIDDSYGGGVQYEAAEDEVLSQMIIGPESGETSRYYSNDCYHLYIKPTAGVYEVSEIVFPAGYELDDAVVAKYPLSVEVTEEDVKEYNEWAQSGDSAGCKEFKIEIPIKKIGQDSLVYAVPSTKMKVIQESYGTVLSFDTTNTIDPVLGKTTYKILYSTKKAGKYKTLCKNYEKSDFFIGDGNKDSAKLKDGKTYYIKVQPVKQVGAKKIEGKMTSATKVKVKRSKI